MTGHDASEKFYLWRSRVTFALTFLAVTVGFVLGGLADPPRNPPPMTVRVVLLGGAAAFLLMAGRALRMSVIVAASEVTIKNVLGTVGLVRDDVVAVVMPDDIAVAPRPLIRTKSGAEIRVSALSRVKNRAWGDERASREQARQLAAALGVDLIEDPDAATRHHFG